MEKITARTNEKIKYASHLAESASFRRENGEFLLEGARLCSDAAQTGVEISAAFFTAKALWKYPEYIESIKPVSGICYARKRRQYPPNGEYISIKQLNEAVEKRDTT